jgi:hypothetical protein
VSIARASGGVIVMASLSKLTRLMMYRVPGFQGLFSQNAKIPPGSSELKTSRSAPGRSAGGMW